jgi:AraC-like DNA-binding protein
VIYRTIIPPPPLDAFIANVWYWEEDNAPTHAKDLIIATRSVGLLINLNHDALSWYGSDDEYATKRRLTGMALCGTQSSAFAINAHQPRMMGIQFKPGGIWPFLAPDGHEFHNRHVDLADLWGADARRLHQRLTQAPTPDARMALLLDAFVARAPRDFAHHPAVALALNCFERAPHRATVAAIARRAEISPKKFIRLFSEQVGMTPKLYLRVARFERVVTELHAKQQIGWGDVVAQNGFYDQSHFIRDFRQFSGLSPTQWLKQRGPYVHHVPLRD